MKVSARSHAIASVLALLALPVVAQSCPEDVSCRECPKSAEGRPLPDGLKRFYALDGLILKSYQAGDFKQATALANEYLNLASVYRCDWNHGNAVHDANRYLGLIAVRSGDRSAAAAFLLKAGKSKGSPQLDTFGPELDLADALLQDGQTDAVKAYLKDIKKFWEMDDGKVDAWLADIEKGGKPRLDRFAMRLGGMMFALMVFSLAWPVLTAIGSLYVLRRKIRHKWLFVILSAALGYGLMRATQMATTFAMQSLTETIAQLNAYFILGLAWFASVAAFIAPVLGSWALARFFRNKETSLHALVEPSP